MRYKDLLGAIKSINNVAERCSENLAILLTFHHDKEATTKRTTSVTATLVDSYGEIICSSTMDLLSDALASIGVDVDPRNTDSDSGVAANPSSVNGRKACLTDHAVLSADYIASSIAASTHTKLSAIDAIALLKKDIQDQMRKSGSIGDYARAAALRQKSAGVTMAMQVASSRESK